MKHLSESILEQRQQQQLVVLVWISVLACEVNAEDCFYYSFRSRAMSLTSVSPGMKKWMSYSNVACFLVFSSCYVANMCYNLITLNLISAFSARA